MSTTHEEGREYDIIFAGGGTCACVAAARLAQADPNLSILIIERGTSGFDNPAIFTPALFWTNYAPTCKNILSYEAESEEKLGRRKRLIATGGCLGGGSAVNAMMYSRAVGRDFDSFGVEGWKKGDLIKCARKAETVDDLNSEWVESVHGTAGPVHISYGTFSPSNVQDDFIEAAESYGFPYVPDLEDFEAAHGFSKSPKYIGPDGRRQDAASRYIRPLLADGKHPNLHLLLQSRVRRVLFEGKRATGVEYESEAAFFDETGNNNKQFVNTVNAKRLVVVSAGTFGTPQILERSGIGNKNILAGLDIPVVADLPGVGENFQDHHFLLSTYRTTLGPNESMDDFTSMRVDFAQAIKERDTRLGGNSIEVAGKLRMTDAEAQALGTHFKSAWDKDFAKDTSKPIMLTGLINLLLGGHDQIKEEDERIVRYATIGCYTPYPYSRGSVHITSQDCNTAPKFVTGFLSDANDIDLKKQVWAYKRMRDLFRRTNIFAGELEIGHPKFRAGSKAALTKGPLRETTLKGVQERSGIQPVVYDEDDDHAIEAWVRENLETTWHSLGTCKMGRKDEHAVVDENLNVYETAGLKCCDLSIIPENVAANTYNTALIVGEKAAEIIGRELGLSI